MTDNRPSILACVTSQFDCDRIISTAKQIADAQDCELRVLTVLKPMTDYREISDQIEYLYLVSKENGADMTVLFNPDAVAATADFVNKSNVNRIVTGMHDGGSESFLVMFNRYSPDVAITMVAKDDKVYSMEVCTVSAR